MRSYSHTHIEKDRGHTYGKNKFKHPYKRVALHTRLLT